MSTRRQPGRRPGNPDTREAILAAGRDLFAAKGFDGASVREIARAAGVDPALINHYFGSKEGLFQAVLDVPVDPADLAREIFVGADPQDLPERMVRTFFTMWEGPETGPAMLGMLRRVLGDPTQLTSLRAFMMSTLMPHATSSLTGIPIPEARLRFTLAVSHLLGVILARHVLLMEPLASLPQDRLVAAITPVIAHYLLDDLPPEGDRP